jgi:hypothetical protein
MIEQSPQRTVNQSDGRGNDSDTDYLSPSLTALHHFVAKEPRCGYYAVRIALLSVCRRNVQS